MKKIIDNSKFLMHEKHSRRYHNMENKNELMLGCADTDFKFSNTIKDTLIKIANNGDLSYSFFDKQINEAVSKWYKKYNLNLEDENIIIGSGVMHLIQVVLSIICSKGDGVIIQAPVYAPFYEVIKIKELKVYENHLKYNEKNGKYTFDLENFEELAKKPETKALILCSPHNPIGRVWNKEELSKLSEICLKHNIFIISDEIWSDILFDCEHIPIFNIEKAKMNSIVLNSVGKSFNLGGAHLGYGISQNKDFIEKMKINLRSQILYASSNYVSSKILIECYTNSEALVWLEDYKSFLKSNQEYFYNEITKNTNIIVTPAESTYVVWLNFKHVASNCDEVKARMKKINICGSDGNQFCTTQNLFYRLNVGTNKSNLKILVERIIAEFKNNV